MCDKKLSKLEANVEVRGFDGTECVLKICQRMLSAHIKF
jgi:hypothetical protein